MNRIDINAATDRERNQAAMLLARSEPWITLGISLDQCKKSCYNPEFFLYVAHVRTKLAGIILLDPCGVAGSPYLKSIAVHPDFQGQGIGSALLSFAEDLFRKEARHMFLCVSSFNNKAQKFYENFGYHAVGEFKDYLVQGKSEILMHKWL